MEIGTTINRRYAIDGVLGHGQMGHVYRVQDIIAGGVPYALKVLRDEGLKTRFLQEFDLLRRISHPGFPRAIALDIERDNQGLCAVLECCEGQTIEEAYERVDPVAFATFLLEAVDHLHRLGLVHGDIAPTNVMLLDDGSFKLLDLGAAGEVGTGSGSASGVLHYAAPERLAGEPLSPRTDLWSLGCTIYRVLHGQHPWPGYPARSPREFELPSSRVEHPIDAVIARLMKRDPSERYKSASAALKDLASITGQDGPSVSALASALAFPFVDVGSTLAEVVARLANARRAGLPHLVEVCGPPGSGRTRYLNELSNRLAAMGVQVIRVRPLPGDEPGGPLLRALRVGGDVSGEPDTADYARHLVRQILKQFGRDSLPTAILIDDVDQADEVTRQALQALNRTFSALPERCGELQLIQAGDQGDVSLLPFEARHLERLLEQLFPERRAGARIVDPILDKSGGNAELIHAIIGRLLASNALRVDAAALRLDAQMLDTLKLPETLSLAAEQAVAALSDEAKRAAALLARARTSLPISMIASCGQELIARGVAVPTAGNEEAEIAIASVLHAEAAAVGITSDEAHRTLAAWWRERGDKGRELSHRLAMNETGAAGEAEALLEQLPRPQAMELIGTLMSKGRPDDARIALAAAKISASCGRIDWACTLCGRAALSSDRVIAAEAKATLGSLEVRSGAYGAARKSYEEALKRGGEAISSELKAEILAGLSRSALMLGGSEDATRWATEGLALVAGDAPAIRGRLGYTLGLAAWYRGDLDAAEQALEEALRRAEIADDGPEAAAVITAQGLVAHRRGALDRAVELYEEALRRGEAIGDDSRVLIALQNLGVTYHQEGDWARALATYKEALSYAEAEHQMGRIMQVAANLGNLWRYLGQSAEARTVLGRGLEIARQEGNRFMEGLILTNMGEVALTEESWEEAERLLSGAIEAAVEGSRHAEEVEARLDKARLDVERADYSGAVSQLDAVLALTEDDPGSRSRASALLARVHREWSEGEADRSKTLIGKALETADAITNLDVRWPVFLEAARAAEDAGDVETMVKYAAEVQTALTDLEDLVPGPYRESFRAVRNRREAREITEEMMIDKTPQTKTSNLFSDDTWLRLLEINKRLTTETDVRRLLEYIMDSAILLTGAERGFLLLDSDAARESSKLDISVARNIDQENIRNTKFKISRSIASRVIEEGDAIVTVDAMEDSRYRDHLSVHDLKLRSVLCLPMRVRGKVLGAIYLDNRFRAGAFDDGHFRFMEAFSDQAGIALHNARLISALEDSKQDLESARQAVEALNEQLKEELQRRTQELEESHRVVIAQQKQLTNRHQYDRIIGESAAIQKVFRVMDRLLDNTIPVLISGESGTGKELVARAIHFSGKRSERPFVAINCGAIPANLLESELFGHVRGAFTGATADKKGLFEAAHNGTLFLDELGELALDMQVKLLRVLQDGQIKKVGSTKDVQVDVRIIAATNRKLEEEVAAGRFREDLFYRLSVVPITIPPLRQRHEDVPLLVQHFIGENAKAGLGCVTGISSRALSLLQKYEWPGNVRQLEMVLKNVSLFAEDAVLDTHDFNSFPEITGSSSGAMSGASLSGRTLADIEREAIIQALTDNRGNKKKSAEQLGIDRRTLYNKLKAYNIVIEKEFHVN